MKKNILFVYDSMMSGGSTTSLLSLLNVLPKDKYDIDLLLYINEGPFLEQVPKDVHLLKPAYAWSRRRSTVQKMGNSILNGELFKYFGIIRRNRVLSQKGKRSVLAQLSVDAQVALSRKIKKQYDVAIGFMELWANAFVASDEVSASQKIAWVHCNYLESGLIGEIDENRWNAFCKIALVSATCMQAFIHVFPKQKNKCFIAKNILSQTEIRKRAGEDWSVSSNKEFIIVSVCRIDFKSKGLDRAIRAMADYLKTHDMEEVNWYIIGDGPDRKTLEAMINQFHLENTVQIFGMLSNPLKVEKNCDAFFLPSRYEGKPIAVTEALMLGLPCFVTEYSSAHEQIIQGLDGFIFENSDRGTSYAIKYIMEHKNDIRNMKSAILAKDYSEMNALDTIVSIL